MYTTPRRFTTLHFEQRFFTEADTFINLSLLQLKFVEIDSRMVTSRSFNYTEPNPLCPGHWKKRLKSLVHPLLQQLNAQNGLLMTHLPKQQSIYHP